MLVIHSQPTEKVETKKKKEKTALQLQSETVAMLHTSHLHVLTHAPWHIA